MSRVITAPRLLIPLAVFQLCASMAPAAVTFELTFPDVVNDTNGHWDDPTYGAQARATLLDVLNEFGREFQHTAVIQLEINSVASAPYAAIASTASYHQVDGGFRDGNTYIKITTGNDLNGAAVDGG